MHKNNINLLAILISISIIFISCSEEGSSSDDYMDYQFNQIYSRVATGSEEYLCSYSRLSANDDSSLIAFADHNSVVYILDGDTLDEKSSIDISAAPYLGPEVKDIEFFNDNLFVNIRSDVLIFSNASTSSPSYIKKISDIASFAGFNYVYDICISDQYAFLVTDDTTSDKYHLYVLDSALNYHSELSLSRNDSIDYYPAIEINSEMLFFFYGFSGSEHDEINVDVFKLQSDGSIPFLHTTTIEQDTKAGLNMHFDNIMISRHGADIVNGFILEVNSDGTFTTIIDKNNYYDMSAFRESELDYNFDSIILNNESVYDIRNIQDLKVICCNIYDSDSGWDMDDTLPVGNYIYQLLGVRNSSTNGIDYHIVTKSIKN